jgi:poly(hydroxyalkanoate) depolymerase family esterase
MRPFSPRDLIEATRLTQAGRLTDATSALQRMMGGLGEQVTSALKNAQGGLTIDGVVQPATASAGAAHAVGFLDRTFSNQAGTRPYKLFIPTGYHGQPVPLIVMLHGCSQSPDDFAAGTRMNLAAEAQTCLVAYPGQTSAANMQKCWNWFNAGDQQRDQGEPSLIAGITRQVMRDYAVDPARVYVAGLSAGGAAASIMGNAYADLYAAIGVHSGMACGAARDMQSAFAVMQRGGDGSVRTSKQRHVPTIVFHGERDTTVNARNGDAVVAQAVQGASVQTRVEAGQVPNGHAYTRTLHSDAAGRTLVEKWVVRGAGHAWFGGSSTGSYTDPRGPDATKEMLRFFLQHPL